MPTAPWYLRLLRFLRLVDGNALSLTNLVLLVAVYKLAHVDSPSVVDLLGVVTAMLAYAHKRSVTAKSSGAEVSVSEALEAAKQASGAVQALQDQLKQTKAEIEARVNTVLLGRR
jgi:hypothetical protein